MSGNFEEKFFTFVI